MTTGSTSSSNQQASLGPNLKWNAVVQASTSNTSTPFPPLTSSSKKNSLSSASPIDQVPELSSAPSSVLPKRRGIVRIIDDDDPLSEILQIHSQSISADWKVVGNPVGTKPFEATQSRVESPLVTPIASSFRDSPITQLPMSLNEEIGLDDPNEVAQIFERTSISAPPHNQFINSSFQALPPPTFTNNIKQPIYATGPGRACSISGVNYQNYPTEYIGGYSQRRTSFLDNEPELYCGDTYFYEYTHNIAPPRHSHLLPRFPHPIHYRRHSTNLNYSQRRNSQHSDHDLTSECMLNCGDYVEESFNNYHDSIEYCTPQSAPPGLPAVSPRYSISSQLSQPAYIGMDPYNATHPVHASQPISGMDSPFQPSSFKGSLYTVEFKASRTGLFYILEIDGKPVIDVNIGDYVIVEADRGEDLGKITRKVSLERVKKLLLAIEDDKLKKPEQTVEPELLNVLNNSKEIVPKRIYRFASPHDLKLLQAKAQEEAIAMVRCQSCIRQRKLPMEMIDAEYQWYDSTITN
jgi:hypothetical protein